MTKRSELSHRRAELKARLQTSIAARLFSRSRTGLDGLVKKLMKADRAPTYTDPDLAHPDPKVSEVEHARG